MSDIQKQAKIAELQARIAATTGELEDMNIENQECLDMRYTLAWGHQQISEVVSELRSYADELKRIAEAPDAE